MDVVEGAIDVTIMGLVLALAEVVDSATEVASYDFGVMEEAVVALIGNSVSTKEEVASYTGT